MKQSFNLIDMPTQDMINDQLPVEDIVAVAQFQTSINCGATIESLEFVDLNQYVDGDAIVSMIYMIAVVNGESFKIIISTTKEDILKQLLTYSSKSESEIQVMEYVRHMLE